MKTFKLFVICLMTILCVRCMPLNYYQEYKATFSENMAVKNNLIVFQDDNCKVYYNLWAENGDIGFQFYNNTNRNIYLNMEHTFLVLNGMANNYFKNRTFTTSQNSGEIISNMTRLSKSLTGVNYQNLLQTNQVTSSNKMGVISSSGYSISYNEDKIICIPPFSSKLISEYSINNVRYQSCDLYKYPDKRSINTVSFTKENSPVTFSNRIEYFFDSKDEPILIKNDFYVTDITNYPENEFIIDKYDIICDKKSETTTRHFKNPAPDKFYLIYK